MNRKIKWIQWCWLALTLLFLFFRLQNIQGVFTPQGIVINDTDPYYRLHRIEYMLNQHEFYPLHEPNLNYPNGLDIPWPLGLDLVVALPLYLYHSTSRAEIESFGAICIPFLSLPLLWFSGWIGTFLAGPVFGLLLGLLITCSSTLIYQTNLGRLDHHFLEAFFPIALLMFLLKYFRTRQKSLLLISIFILGLAPSFAPQAWILGILVTFGIFFERRWDILPEFSKMFFYSFLLSLIPLSFSNRFYEGSIHWGSFSWWTPFVYISIAMTFAIIDFVRKKTKPDLIFNLVLSGFFLALMIFLFIKNGVGFLPQNIQQSIVTVTANAGTMATTLEARSPLMLSLENWIHGDTYILLAASLCLIFFLFRKRWIFIIGFSIVPIILSFFQIRFMAMSMSLMFIILLLFFHEWCGRAFTKQKWKTLALLIICLIMIVPFRPYFGLLSIENTHYYYKPIRSFTLFLNNEFKERQIEKKDQAILAHWDYGHWLLYYTGLPVVSDPFQGPSAFQVLELFTSKGTEELEPFLKKFPAHYLVIESGAKRSMHWLQAVHKNTDIYFEKNSEYDGQDYFKTTPAFDDLFMFRFFFELGLGSDNSHPKHWRLIYISPYSSPGDTDISALKVFEKVPGVNILAHSTKSRQKLYLQAEILEKDDASVFQQITTGSHDFRWTVPYGTYYRGGVSFDGKYKILDENGQTLARLPVITEEQVLRGDTVRIRF